MTGFAGQARMPDGTSEWNRLEFAIRAVMNRTATIAPVVVKAASGLSVDIQPMVHQLDGADNAVPHGIIHGVPVWRYQGGTSAVIMDPQPGDIGVALFASSDISSVKANKTPSQPGSRRKFSWSDAIYLGGILNPEPTQFVRMLAAGGIDVVANGTITISADNGDGTVRLKGSLVSTSEALAAGNGATGAFVSQDGKTVTVIDGIITRIV